MTEAPGPGGADRRLEEVTKEFLVLYEEVNVLYTVSEIAARSAGSPDAASPPPPASSSCWSCSPF